jgi:hypothetical protein
MPHLASGPPAIARALHSTEAQTAQHAAQRPNSARDRLCAARAWPNAAPRPQPRPGPAIRPPRSPRLGLFRPETILVVRLHSTVHHDDREIRNARVTSFPNPNHSFSFHFFLSAAQQLRAATSMADDGRRLGAARRSIQSPHPISSFLLSTFSLAARHRAAVSADRWTWRPEEVACVQLGPRAAPSRETTVVLLVT